MINLIRNNLDTFIAIVTLVISVSVIFLGLDDEKKGKKEQLKFILISYAVIISIILFFSTVPIYVFVILILFFFLGGLSYSLNETFDLEKELSIIQLLFYSSFSWFSITNNYFLLFGILLSFMLKFNYYISLLVIGGCLILQYLSIVKDYFGIKSYGETFSQIKNINLGVKNDKQPKDVFETEFLTEKLELVAFVVYVEDRYLFDRKQVHLSFTNILDSKRDPVIFNGKISYENDSCFNKYKRGYSTIEQQLIRQYSISDNAYRYKVRRKLFFDWIYTPLFSKAICYRKSKVYGKNKKLAKKELIWHLKMMFLYNYFVNVLGNPEDKDELLTVMSKQSRVSQSVYEKMFQIFKDSLKKDEMIEKIEINMNRVFNFY